MKKQFLSALLAACLLASPLHASAAPLNDDFIAENDAFCYQNCTFSVKDPSLLPEGEDIAYYVIVTGVTHIEGEPDEYMLTRIGEMTFGAGTFNPERTPFFWTLDDAPLHEGDVLCLHGDWCTLEVDPPIYEWWPPKDGELRSHYRTRDEMIGVDDSFMDYVWNDRIIENLGSGTALFGAEFMPALRHMIAINAGYQSTKNSRCDKSLLTLGDVDEDGEVALVDVIRLNRSLLGMEQLNMAAKVLADVNSDGTADATDSLLMLQYTVHLVDSLGA